LDWNREQPLTVSLFLVGTDASACNLFLLGLAVVAASRGWKVDKGFVSPIAKAGTSKIEIGVEGRKQLENLAGYVSYLEAKRT